MPKLYIIRHGKTDFNEQGRYLGRIDISLNSVGRREVALLAERIKNSDIDIIVSSPLKRAIETAEIVKPVGCKIVVNDAFIERAVGVYGGLTKDGAKEKYPDLYRRNITRIFDDAPTGGETIFDVQNRVFEGLDEIKKNYKNKNILLATHAFVAKVINKYFNPQIAEKDFFDFVLGNGDVAEYQI